MARGRMISKSLSTSERFAALYDTAGKLAEFCQSLYPLLLSHADDWGCLPGDVFTVKHLIHPTSPRKSAEFEMALSALHRVGLVTWYEAEGKQYVAIRGWYSHQQLKGHDQDGRKRAIPAPPENIKDLASSAQIRPTVPKSALTELNLTEGKGTETNPLRDRFERFWEMYPKKVGKDAAWVEFQKRNPGDDLTDEMIAVVEAQRASEQWRKEGGQYIPNPRTWLHQGRWQDEVAQPARKAGVYSGWIEECQELHGGVCTKQWDHGMRMKNEKAS